MTLHIVLTDSSTNSFSTTHPVWTLASPQQWDHLLFSFSISLFLHPSSPPSLWPVSVLQLAGSVRDRDPFERSTRQLWQRAGQQGAGVLLPELQDGDGGPELGAGRAGKGACGEDAGAHPPRRCQGKQRHVPTLRSHAQNCGPMGAESDWYSYLHWSTNTHCLFKVWRHLNSFVSHNITLFRWVGLHMTAIYRSLHHSHTISVLF